VARSGVENSDRGATGQSIAAGLSANPAVVEKSLRRYVIRRIGRPDDVAGLVLFLASESASWITGQTYPVNGGYSFAV